MRTVVSFILFTALFIANATAQKDTITMQNNMNIEKEITALEKQWAGLVLVKKFLPANKLIRINRR